VDVPSSDPDTLVLFEPMPPAIRQTYVGIYRFDKHANESVLSRIWERDGALRFDQNVTDTAEAWMIALSELEIDSSSLHDPPDGWYSISYCHLSPYMAQWTIWAAANNQDSLEFLDGYNWIRNKYWGLPAVPLDSIMFLCYLNHLVFYMAEMEFMREKFPGPPETDSIEIPDLEPYALLQTYPEHWEEQNDSDGIYFSAIHSFDADGEIESYSWVYDDGSLPGPQGVRIKYDNYDPGMTAVILAVVDNSGNESADTVYVPFSNGVIDDVAEIDQNNTIPVEFKLGQNYPNPFNASTVIPLSLPRLTFIELRILNVLGQEIRTLATGRFNPGTYRVEWDGRDNIGNEVSSGTYLYQMKSNSSVDTKKLVLLR
jgi:hypothetical protein